MKYFIITGATGDLATTKLYPALAETFAYNKYLPDTQFLGAGRKDLSQEEYQQLVHSSLSHFEGKKDFIQDLQYVQIDFDNIETINNFFVKYNIKAGDEVILYMAIPPQAFDSVVDTLSEVKRNYPNLIYKLVFEKPFGSDLQSAQHLNQKVSQCFREEEIYRVDHYLGKETIQNILALRFGNSMFEPLLNNHYVESIKIDVWEERGIDKRADYFDKTGIIKDILQNHILQTLALITMEAPVAMEAEYIRDEKHKLIKSLRPIQNQDVILGQYISSDGKLGYLQEDGVTPNYADKEKTENTRVSYPLYHIDNIMDPSMGGIPKNIFFLTADAFGVLPPISKLTSAQAMYHFISGYTAKVAGTEAGVTEPQATFSACFGQAFLPLHPAKYAEMLGKKLNENPEVNVWLVNTGWTGGPYGVGNRMKLSYTRAMITAALEGKLNGEFIEHPVFGMLMPTSCENVPTELLNPRNTWADATAYDAQCQKLAELFNKNFEKFADGSSNEIKAAAPKLTATN